jgi:hypothetical protein
MQTGRRCGSCVDVGARFQMLMRDAGGCRVQAQSSVPADAVSGVGFGVGLRELRASHVDVGAVSRRVPCSGRPGATR